MPTIASSPNKENAAAMENTKSETASVASATKEFSTPVKTPAKKPRSASKSKSNTDKKKASKQASITQFGVLKTLPTTAKKRIEKTVKKKRTIKDMEEEEQQILSNMKRLKANKTRLEKELNTVKYPIADEQLVNVMPPRAALPLAVVKLPLPEDQVSDALFVWDFLHTFGIQLRLKHIDIEDFIPILTHSASDSVVVTEILISLLRLLLSDNTLATSLSNSLPKHLNFASREHHDTEQSHHDVLYNGLKLLPLKLRPSFVTPLCYGAVLRAVLPRLPLFNQYMRSQNIQVDVQSQQPETDSEGDASPNVDFAHNISCNYSKLYASLSGAVAALETNDFYALSAEHKIAVLRLLCLSCYDTEHLHDLLEKNNEERQNQIAAMHKTKADKRRNLPNDIKEKALEIYKKQLDGKSANNSKKKDTKKNKAKSERAPSNASIMNTDAFFTIAEDLLLQQSVGVDEIVPEAPELPPPPPEAALRRRATSSSLSSWEDTVKARENAIEACEYALQYRLRTNIREAIKCGVPGGLKWNKEGKEDVVCCAELLWKVYKLQHELETADREYKQMRQHEKAMAEYFVRSQPMGQDRNGDYYWRFDGDDRMFVEHRERCVATSPNVSGIDASTFPTNYTSTWSIYGNITELAMLVDALDDRGVRELALKQSIRSHFDMTAAEGIKYETQGSEYIGKKVKRTFGKRVVIGVITGWLPATTEDPAIWHVLHIDGDEEDLELHEVQSCLVDDSASVEEVAMEVDEAEGSSSEPAIIRNYYNNVAGGLMLRKQNIGLAGLRNELTNNYSMVHQAIRNGKHYNKDVKKVWECKVKEAMSVDEMKECVLELENMLHRLQNCEDEVESVSTDEALDEQWQTDEEHVGKRVRRFFEAGRSDGTVVAMLPAEYNEGIALWHMKHDDHDEEDLDYEELVKAIEAYEKNITESVNGSASASDESDQGEEDLKTLWPSANVRNRWIAAVQASTSVSEVAWALSSLMEHAKNFGVTTPDPLGVLSPRKKSMWRRESRGKTTKGGRELRVRKKISYAEE